MLKGLTTIGGIIGLVSAVITGGLIITAFGTVDAEILEPGVNNITDRLDEFSTPTVRIGDDGVDQKTAKGEFRGLVTYNMLTAANCNLVPATTDGLEGGETEVDHFKGFDDAVDGLDYEFTGDCVPLIVDPPSGILDIINPFSEIQESSDLEGRQGKVNINITQSFVISEEKLITANFEDEVVKGSGFLFNGQPDFWNKHRVAGFVPNGITGPEGSFSENMEAVFGETTNRLTSTDWIESDDSAPSYSKLYYYRVMMTGVPTIIDNDNFRGYDDLESFKTFVKDAKYQFCKGAEGTIQSNAKYIDFGGEAQGDKSVKENAVYPEVQITEGSRSCLEDIIHESKYNGRDFVDYSIAGDECTYQAAVQEEDHESDETGVRYECMLMEDSTSFPEYTGQVEFLKTGWKADQSTCELDPDDITDRQPTSLETSNGNPSQKIIQSFEEYSPPYGFTTEVTLSHPDDNDRPGELYFDLPNDIPNEVVVIDMENPLANNKRVEIDILNTDGGAARRYDRINIESPENSQSFKLTYEGSTLTVEHIGSDRSISMNLQPDEPGQRNIIEGEPEQFSMWINDPGATELNQEMSLDVEDTILEAYPLGCVPEAMN